MEKIRMPSLGVLILGLLLLLGACAASQPAVPGQGKTFTVTKKTYGQVWRAALAAFTKNLNIEKMDRDRGVMVGVKPLWGSGQRVTLFIRPAGKKSKVYTLEIVNTVRDDPTTDWGVFMASEIKDAL